MLADRAQGVATKVGVQLALAFGSEVRLASHSLPVRYRAIDVCVFLPPFFWAEEIHSQFAPFDVLHYVPVRPWPGISTPVRRGCNIHIHTVAVINHVRKSRTDAISCSSGSRILRDRLVERWCRFSRRPAPNCNCN